jgi:ribosomal protein L22
LKVLLNELKGKTYQELLIHFKTVPTKNNTHIWQTIYNGIICFCNKYKLLKENIKITEIIINKGSILTRKRPGPKGRSLDIQKKKSKYIIKYSEI